MNNSLDDRHALIAGSRLSYNGTEYVIGEELGRGGSCIVYSANRTSADGVPQTVRIKECYPAYLGIIRCADDSLSVPPESEAAFRYFIGRFNRVFSINQELRNMQGTTNSTIDSSEMFSSNGTEYIVMRCVEGEDYSSSLDDSANSVILRALALAKILKKYHENGLLHLDIKPENMFIIPETKEHIVLFDLDSIVSMDELRSGRPCVSYSEDYAAPEVRGQQYKDINICSDFYSVGALVYMKLFGRVPHALSLHEPVEVADIGFPDERYQPVFFRKLSAFFQKTLAVSPRVRFKSDDELIESLEELRKLSDLNGVQIISNFGYDSANFVGRKNELKRIDEVFGTNHVVFLSGIGGIGKTEIAKKYASINSNMLNRILFCHFSGSIESTINTEIQITCCEPESGEDSRKYYVRKLRALQWLLTEQDMIILDNFDVSSDEDLDELLNKCRCKFIITTREDYSDYNYEQINVECFNDINDALKLFTAYNGRSYAAQEQDCIVEMIELLERHTMTVEMTAKYLDDSDVLPSEFIKELRTNEGITSANEVEIDQRKDGKRRSMIINDHLLMLFNMTGFSNEEKELIGSLALMGGIAVSRKTFLGKFCVFPGNKAAMQKLIKTGWVRFDGATGKIALHQVIMDLVYNDLHPDAGSCPHIVEAMGKYAMQPQDGMRSLYSTEICLYFFFDRLSGKSNDFVRSILTYSYYEKYSLHVSQYQYDVMHILEKAEKACENSVTGNRFHCMVIWHMIWQIGYELLMYKKIIYTDLNGLIERFVTALGNSDLKNRSMISAYLKVAWELDDRCKCFDRKPIDDFMEDSFADMICSCTDMLFEKAYYLVESSEDISALQRIKYLSKIRFFYTGRNQYGADIDITCSYRLWRIKESSCAAKCLDLIKRLSVKDFSVPDTLVWKKYDTTLEFSSDKIYSIYRTSSFFTDLFYHCQINIEECNNMMNDYLFLIAGNLRIGKNDEAFNCTVQALKSRYSEEEKSRENELVLWAAYSCAAIGNYYNAVRLCKYILKGVFTEYGLDEEIQIKANYLIFLVSKCNSRQKYRQECFSLYEREFAEAFDKLTLSELTFPWLDIGTSVCSYDDVLGRFLIDYWQEKYGINEAVKKCLYYVIHKKLVDCLLTEYIIEASLSNDFTEFYILACLHMASSYKPSDAKRAEEWFSRAMSHLNDHDPAKLDKYLLQKIYQSIVDNGFDDNHTYLNLCDFYLIQETETCNLNSIDIAEYLMKFIEYRPCYNLSHIRCYKILCNLLMDNIDSDEYIVISSIYRLPGLAHDLYCCLKRNGFDNEADELLIFTVQLILSLAETEIWKKTLITFNNQYEYIADCFCMLGDAGCDDFNYLQMNLLNIMGCIISINQNIDFDIMMVLISPESSLEKISNKLSLLLTDLQNNDIYSIVWSFYSRAHFRFYNDPGFKKINDVIRRYLYDHIDI